MGRKMVTVEVWGGFVDGKLHVTKIDDGHGGFGSEDAIRKIPALFTNWKIARSRYQDVRRVELFYNEGKS